MFARKLVKKLKALKKFKKYDNQVEANYYTLLIKKIFGMVVIEYKMECGVLKSTLTYWGLLSFVFWYGLFLLCVYNSCGKRQTILRRLYNTRLGPYGDQYEMIATFAFVMYAMWKLPFRLYGDTRFIKHIIEIDKALKRLGLNVDYNTKGILSLTASLSQIAVYILRTFSICVTLNNLDISIPYEKLYQVVFSDAIALILSGHYCFYVLMVKEKYAMLNKVMEDIYAKKAWEYTVFIRDKPNKERAIQLQEKYICEKVELCAKIYSMLYDASIKVIEMFGLSVVLTAFLGFNNVVLYLFYFMEATASGLYEDVKRYVYFLAYVLWQTAYASGIIVMVVYYSENTATEVRKAAYVTHEVINTNLNPSVTAAAMRLSLQFVHQKVVFSPCGFFSLDYAFIYEAGRSVLTFLVILLQFVMEK